MGRLPNRDLLIFVTPKGTAMREDVTTNTPGRS